MKKNTLSLRGQLGPEQMAEGLAKYYFGDKALIQSAGSKPPS